MKLIKSFSITVLLFTTATISAQTTTIDFNQDKSGEPPSGFSTTRQVHEYDISDLLGHTIQSVTGTYARSTPETLEDAVNKLAEPRGSVIRFKRKAG